MSLPAEQLRGRYVFLASNAYSGSTLLSLLVGAHPSIGTVSDVSGARRASQMATFTCSCGSLMRACPFWGDVEARLRDTGTAFSLADFGLGFDDHVPKWLGQLRVRSLGSSRLEAARDRLFELVPGNERRMREIGARNATFARVILAASGADVFVDASKERLRARYLERYVDPELRVIHLVRDVRGVVESTVRRNKQGLSAAEAARRWARANEAIMRSIGTIPPGRRLMIRYEELCAAPAATMARIFDFCGVDASVDVSELLQRQQHLLGNRMRLRAIGEVGLDARWREAFADAELERIVAAAGPTFSTLYPAAHAAGAGSAGAIHG